MNLEKLWFYAIFYFVFVLVSLGVAAGVKSALADGKADYCYVENTTATKGTNFVGFDLKQHIPWREDRYVVNTRSVEEALAVAKQMGCEVK